MAKREFQYSLLPCAKQAHLPDPPPSEFTSTIISILHLMSEGKSTDDYGCITCYLDNFLDDLKSFGERLEILIQSRVVETSVKLYISEYPRQRKNADDFVRNLLQFMTDERRTDFLDERASVVLQIFDFMWRNVCREDPLFLLTVRSFRDLVERGNYMLHVKYKMDTITQIPPIIVDYLGERLIQDLYRCIGSPSTKDSMESLLSDFRDFKSFSRVLCHAMKQKEVVTSSSPIPERENAEKTVSFPSIFNYLLRKMANRLDAVKSRLTGEGKINEENVQPGWSLYLAILGELNFISKFFQVAEKNFWNELKTAKLSIRALIVRFAKRTDGHDYEWLLEHNDVTDCVSRMHLAMLIISGVNKKPDAELLQMLVDWSQNLDTDLFGAFKQKKLTDSPQVLQDWLCKSCKTIFNIENPLFLTRPDNPTRFYLNPEFNPEPFHHECVEFAGKVIALALMHKVKVGVALDRGFLLQLSDSSSNEENLVSKFSKGFISVFGVSIKELLSCRGLKLKDINRVLCGPTRTSSSHQNVENTNGKREREAYDVDPLLTRYQNVKRLGRNIRNWQRGPELGSGSFGEVYKGLADPGGYFFAAKKVPVTDEHKVSSIEHEIGLLCQLNHENIVEYYGTKKEEEHFYIFLEFVNGGSLDSIYKEFPLNESQVSCYTKQILAGLKHLHERVVMHGDIKCANILLKNDGCVKIADFGLAKVTEFRKLRKSGGGTPAWSAPEVVNLRRQGGYGLEADIWSLGCTVLEMLTGKRPYYPLLHETTVFKIGTGKPPSIPDTYSVESRDFIQKCLQVNPKERPTAAMLLEHPFIKRS